MSERVDFSRNAGLYDRRHGAVLSADDARALARAGVIAPGARILDIGAGTGRVAIPLGELGCDVCALDPAVAMLEVLRTKSRDLPLRLLAAEGARLPFADRRFDVVVIARLLYLTVDWRELLREAHRVLAIGGRLLHEWGNGDPDEEWVQIREQARALFEDAGVASPFHPGVRSEREVDEQLEQLGFARTAVVPLGPGPSAKLSEFLRRLATGELSYIWRVPEDVQAQCVPPLAAWAAERFDLERSVPMPRNSQWTVYESSSSSSAS